HKALTFEPAQEFFENAAFDHHDDDGLEIPFGMGEDMNAPGDLGDRHGRESLQLELDHGQGLIEIAAGELSYAEENVFGRQPGDIEFTLKEGAPVFGDD